MSQAFQSSLAKRLIISLHHMLLSTFLTLAKNPGIQYLVLSQGKTWQKKQKNRRTGTLPIERFDIPLSPSSHHIPHFLKAP